MLVKTDLLLLVNPVWWEQSFITLIIASDPKFPKFVRIFHHIRVIFILTILS
jgi:hypothetical protein